MILPPPSAVCQGEFERKEKMRKRKEKYLLRNKIVKSKREIPRGISPFGQKKSSKKLDLMTTIYYL